MVIVPIQISSGSISTMNYFFGPWVAYTDDQKEPLGWTTSQ